MQIEEHTMQIPSSPVAIRQILLGLYGNSECIEYIKTYFSNDNTSFYVDSENSTQVPIDKKLYLINVNHGHSCNGPNLANDFSLFIYLSNEFTTLFPKPLNNRYTIIVYEDYLDVITQLNTILNKYKI